MKLLKEFSGTVYLVIILAVVVSSWLYVGYEKYDGEDIQRLESHYNDTYSLSTFNDASPTANSVLPGRKVRANVYDTRIAGVQAGLMIALTSDSSVAKNFVLSDVVRDNQVATSIEDGLYLLKKRRGRGVHTVAGYHDGGVVKVLFPNTVSYSKAASTAKDVHSALKHEIQAINHPLVALRPIFIDVFGGEDSNRAYDTRSLGLMSEEAFRQEVEIRNRSALTLTAPNVAVPEEKVQFEVSTTYDDVESMTWTVSNTRTDQTVVEQTVTDSFDVERYEDFRAENEGMHRINLTLRRKGESEGYSRVDFTNVDEDMGTAGIR